MSDDVSVLLREGALRASTDPVEVKIRSLLSLWGAKRRGYRIVAEINRTLVDAGLTTDPPFNEGWIDSTVRLVPYLPAGSTPEPSESDAQDESITHARTMLRVGDVASANKGVVSISPETGLPAAQSIMLRHDFSQLAVASGERSLRGAVSWESIARAHVAAASDLKLVDALVTSTPVARDEDLLGLIPRLIDEGFLFVQNRDKTLAGIVTLADLGQEFSDLATPFFLLGEIERRLRRTVDECFAVEVIREVKSPDDADRDIQSATDLTIGEYKRLLEDPTRWTAVTWGAYTDRKTFIAALDVVREIRNDVMHFSPDPIEADQLDELRAFIKWLRHLDARP